MCVYNGEKYLVEQLESVICQTLLPDEVTIYDDCSTDSTVYIIDNFIRKHNLLNWHININPYNKGWRINFYDALLNCNGDYIFFCDQDDIWYPNKISTMIDIMDANSKILVLNGIPDVVNAENEVIKNLETINIQSNFDHSIHKSDLYDNLFYWKHRIGSTMAIRKILKKQLLFFDRNNLFAHDLWALNISALMGGCYWVDFPVIRYRIHANNASIKLRAEKKKRKEIIKTLENKYNYLTYLYNGTKAINPSLLLKNEQDNLKRIIALFKIRLSIIRDSKIYRWPLLFLFYDIFKEHLSVKQIFVELLEALNLRDKYQLLKAKFYKTNQNKA
jgi:glycosyltransferase involved in cell wall biosynthesis